MTASSRPAHTEGAPPRRAAGDRGPFLRSHSPSSSRPPDRSRRRVAARRSPVHRDGFGGDPGDCPYSVAARLPGGPNQLRLIRLRYYGFDGRSHIGRISSTPPSWTPSSPSSGASTRRVPDPAHGSVDAYHGHDPASMAADNTSGFNCRRAVAPGPPQWSVHAYGEAIDVNPVENPYVDAGVVMPTAGARYLDRADVRPGMAVPGGTLVEAFAAVGWYWGGRWTGSPDYQHFSSTGG